MSRDAGNGTPKTFSEVTLAEIMAALSSKPQPASPLRPSNALSGLTGGIAGAVLSARRRSEWNARFVHWEKPASVTEEGTMERAQSLVSSAIASNSWLNTQVVVLTGQGSYFNNTNVRTEADIDLRVVHPSLKIEYAGDVIVDYARSALSYVDAPLTYEQIFNGLRASLVTDFNRVFGKSNVRVGNKAIRIKGITGTRAEVDVVPAVRYHWVCWLPEQARFATVEGIAILGCDDRWIINFPEQHAANGVLKRRQTAHRFKKMVRIFKRLAIELSCRGLLAVRPASFLIESLVHAVEDGHFLVDADDRYSRARRIALRMQELLSNPTLAASLTEVNGLKLLFAPQQAWNYFEAKGFVDAVVAHLGDA